MVTITLTEKQLRLLQTAMEEYFRLRMGQAWDFADDICAMNVDVFDPDNPKGDLEGKFRYFASRYKNKAKGMVYILTNFGSTMEENLHRIMVTSSLGYDPYVMIYDKPNASKQLKRLQRWCNNKVIFKSCKKFEDYGVTRKNYG